MRKVYKAHFVGTGTLVHIFALILDHVVANDQSDPELIKLAVESKLMDILLDKLFGIYFVLNGYCFKGHLVGCERACFVGEDDIHRA